MLNPAAPEYVPLASSSACRGAYPDFMTPENQDSTMLRDAWNEGQASSEPHSRQSVHAGHSCCEPEQSSTTTVPGRWSELPSELVTNIADRVPELSQAAMREACKAWAPDVSQAVVHLGVYKPDMHFFDRHMQTVCRTFSSLRFLEIYSCHSLTEGAIRSVQGLRRLECLKVVQSDRLARSSSSWIPFLQDLERLTKLVVAVRDKGIKRLGSLTQLASLEIITMTWAENEHLRSLQRLTGLRALTLTSFRGLKDWALMGVLEHTTQLVSLSLSGCFQLSIKTLAELPKLPNLQMLNLSVFKRMTFAGLSSLRELTALHTLDLGFCPAITNEGAQHLQPLTQLYSLVLAGCSNMGDVGVEALTALTNLHALNISKCSRVTDTGFLALRNLPYLACLNALDCPQVSSEAAVEMSWHVKVLLATGWSMSSLPIDNADNITL